MGDTAACTIPAESGRTERLTATLVTVIERDHLSVAAAARAVGVGVETAGTLVRQSAIEREVAEQ